MLLGCKFILEWPMSGEMLLFCGGAESPRTEAQRVSAWYETSLPEEPGYGCQGDTSTDVS